MNINLASVSNSLRLREYYYMVTRHKTIFGIALAVSVFISIILTFTLPKIYMAETVLLIQDEDILKPLISGLAISPSTAHRLRTLREELLSWERITLLVEKLKLDKDIKSPLEYEKMIRSLRDHSMVKVKGANIITMSYEGMEPKQAQDIIQTLSDIIVNGTLTSQKVDTENAIEFLGDQMGSYRAKLEEAEERLRKFKEIYMTSLPVAIQTNEQIVQLKMELNRLMVDNTELHPRVVEIRKLIKQLEDQRDSQMKQAQVEGADISPEDFAKLVSSVPRQEQHLVKLQRDYEVQARIYDSLLQRFETAKLSETLESHEKGPKFKILEPARLPLEPVKPNKVLILTGGVVVGFCLGFLVVFLMDMSNTSIRNLEEAVTILELPVFGSISPINPEEILMEQRLRREVSV